MVQIVLGVYPNKFGVRNLFGFILRSGAQGKTISGISKEDTTARLRENPTRNQVHSLLNVRRGDDILDTKATVIKEMKNDMRVTKNLGMLLLAIWLILYGLSALFGLSFAGLPVVMALLALAAGILILIGR